MWLRLPPRKWLQVEVPLLSNLKSDPWVALFLFAQRSWQTPSFRKERPRPVHGEENPTHKGVTGQRWGLKEVIGS